MIRYRNNPILEAIGTHAWESRLVFNAGAFATRNCVHILYRAMGDDNVSRLGYACSSDGYRIDERLPLPVFDRSNDSEIDGCEDPRLSLIDDSLVMAYTAYGVHSQHQVYQVGLTSIRLADFLGRNWRWNERILAFPGIHNKDAVIFPQKFKGEYVMFHRLEPDVCIARSPDLHRWHGLRFVLGPRNDGWDSYKVGAAGPPLLINEGWLLIYHGVSLNKIYSLGVVLLDKEDPEQVLYRSEEPILTPVEDYERFGKVPNVVFSCGQVMFDDKILIYYGGADTVVCVATYELSELLPKK
ncbi:MAG TPA: hypothetical protein VK209_11890 [Candidatus Sulfotelmatobacter sp.]|nr:hypothetical protein [Candidatus Sulfotelmatobacter sp.]